MMTQANILVMSRSSLSYLAGILIPNKVIWPSNHEYLNYFCWNSSEQLGVNSRQNKLIPGKYRIVHLMPSCQKRHS